MAIQYPPEVDFSAVEFAKDLGLDPIIVHRASPSGNLFLHALLADLGITSDDSIIDIGCGKGSAMAIMNMFPFARIFGIDLSRHVVEIANRNFKILQASKCMAIVYNAVDFPIYHLFNFFYLYNPFPSVVMEKFLAKIGPARGTFIYNNPTCHEYVIDYGWKMVGEYPDEWGNGIYVYRG